MIDPEQVDPELETHAVDVLSQGKRIFIILVAGAFVVLMGLFLIGVMHG